MQESSLIATPTTKIPMSDSS